MSESVSPQNVEAHIQGEVSGQVAVGSYIVQVGSMYGGLIKVAAPETQPLPRLRSTPLRLLPRPFTNLLDRETEIGEAMTALGSCQPVEFYGPVGSGKTVVLRYLAHHLDTEPFPDGVVYLSILQHPLADSLQCIFDAFYECEVPFKPSDAQLRHYLQDKHAVIILDDVELTRDEVGELMDVASGCTFLLASSEQSLMGEGQAIALHGLPLDAAMELIEQELDRPLVSGERPLARALCASLEGHPLRLLQLAAMVREDGRPLMEIASRVESVTDAEALMVQSLEARPEPERRLLEVLAALGGASLHAQHLSAVTHLPNAELALRELQRRGVVQKDGQRYRLNSDIAGVLQRCWTLTPWMEQLLTHLSNWATGDPASPGDLLEEADAIMQVLSWAVANGRWGDALPLIRVFDTALALGKRWETRAQVLQCGLQAAEALGDQDAQAWALNQLGIRALSLGDTATAKTALSKSLRLRESLGDQTGTALTRHNLDALPAVAGCISAALVWAAGLLAVLLLITGGLILSRIWTPTPGPAPLLTSTAITARVQLLSLKVDPETVVGGQPATGTVRLNGPAPPGGCVIVLNSGDPKVVQVSPQVVISAEQASATFPVKTAKVSQQTKVELSASYGSTELTSTLTVQTSPLPVDSVTPVSPTARAVTPTVTDTPPAGKTPAATDTPPVRITPAATDTPPVRITPAATDTPPVRITPAATDTPAAAVTQVVPSPPAATIAPATVE